jgi:Phage integrase, N-terminal SAM-like domain
MEKPTIAKFKPDPGLKLMDQVRQVLRYHHYAYRTEQSYCDWILRYIKFHGGNPEAGAERDYLPLPPGARPAARGAARTGAGQAAV